MGGPRRRSPTAGQALAARVRAAAVAHRGVAAAVVVAVLGLGVAGVAWFEPHKLLVDDRVDEAAPAAAAEAADSDPSPPAHDPAVAPAAPARAAFRSLEHRTTGEAVVFTLGDGTRVLRFEGFETSNGPDLRVYLSAGSDDSSFGREYGEDFVELGVLKGNVGDQNYTIPAGTDLSTYRNAVVWCKRFGVGFGVATFA